MPLLLLLLLLLLLRALRFRAALCFAARYALCSLCAARFAHTKTLDANTRLCFRIQFLYLSTFIN
jgi:hypothetical protein